ncbi:MAG: hypothetical protein M0C28_42145 [Candidatus Moduliflexus flocculans]|nr:hypothetical protein [Candidatus Moduliflexus flocculans]
MSPSSFRSAAVTVASASAPSAVVALLAVLAARRRRRGRGPDQRHRPDPSDRLRPAARPPTAGCRARPTSTP